MNIPVEYWPQDFYTSTKTPSNVDLVNNATAAFYARYLLKRAMAAVDFTLPDEWSRTYFKYILFCRGFGAILEYPEIGVIFQGGTLSERDLYYQPKKFILANPALENKTLNILGTSNDPECVLVKLQPDYTGIADIVSMFAKRIALAYEAWTMNTQNSKLAYVGFFKGKALAQSFKSLFDRIQSGEPAAAVGGDLFDDNGNPRWATFAQDLRANYIAPDISADIRNLLNEFDSFVGIPNNPDFGKRERSVVDEVNANNVETDTILDQIVRTIDEGFNAANEFYGDKLSVKLEVKKRYPVELESNETEVGENEI